MKKTSKLFERLPWQPVWYKDKYAYLAVIIGSSMMALALALQ